MSMNFGVLDFAVGFNRLTAFPLDPKSYFESYDAAVAAAASTLVGLAFCSRLLLFTKDNKLDKKPALSLPSIFSKRS